MSFISTRYSVMRPRSTLTRLPVISRPVMFRTVRLARATPASTASRNPSGEEAMISVTRATATPAGYQPGSPCTSRPYSRRVSAVWLLAWRELARHPLRAALTAGGVACGVALVVAIQAINATTLAAFVDAIDDLAGTAALQVRGPGHFDEAVADRVRAVPGVAHAVPILTDTFFAVDPPVAGEALTVFAADVSDGHAVKTLHLVKSGEQVVDDPLGFLVDPFSIVVTDVFAARAHVAKGDRLRLRTPVGIQTFTVRGVLPPGGVGRAFGGNLVLMDVIGAETVLGRERLIDQVDVTLKPGATADEVAPRVAAVLDPGLEALPPARRGEQIERYLRSYRTLLSGISGLALLAAVFVVGSTVATTVAARRRELGLARAVGAARTQVLRLVVGEAVLAGAAGTALGTAFGLALARALLDVANESTSLIFSMTTFTTGLDVSGGTLALGAVAGLGAAAVAGWMPGRQAAGLSPLAAVRAATTRGRPWPPWPLVAGLAVVTAAALATTIASDSAWSGNVAAVALDALLVCLFMRSAAALARALLRPARARVGVAGRLAVDRLTRLPNALALAAAVLALGLGIMIMAGTLARSFEDSVLDFIRHQVRADLVVASTATTGWIESPLDASLADELARLPGVARVERVRLAEHRYRSERVSVDSLEAAAFGADRRADFVFAAGDPAAALAAVREGRGVLVSRNFARHFDVAPGAPLVLDTPGGRLATSVAGVVVDYVSPRGSVVMARPTYERWWSDRTANRFHVWLAPGASADAVRRAIAEGPGARLGLKVLTQRELYAYHADAVARAFRFTSALEFLPLVVAALGLAEALLAVTLDRRRELAVLRAAGATRGQIARAVVAESAGVGVLGWVGGVAMGVVLSALWVRVNFTVQLGWDLDFHFATSTLPIAAAAALAVSIPAALLPARRAAIAPIVEALRAE
jgi:putative ABC transport system permease protein